MARSLATYEQDRSFCPKALSTQRRELSIVMCRWFSSSGVREGPTHRLDAFHRSTLTAGEGSRSNYQHGKVLQNPSNWLQWTTALTTYRATASSAHRAERRELIAAGINKVVHDWTTLTEDPEVDMPNLYYQGCGVILSMSSKKRCSTCRGLERTRLSSSAIASS